MFFLFVLIMIFPNRIFKNTMLKTKILTNIKQKSYYSSIVIIVNKNIILNVQIKYKDS